MAEQPGSKPCIEAANLYHCNKGHELRPAIYATKREKFKKKGYVEPPCSGHRAMECVKRESYNLFVMAPYLHNVFGNRHGNFSKSDTHIIVSAAVFKKKLLQTCAELIDDKNEQVIVRLFLYNGLQRSFVFKE
ncbi:hypothetical protein TNIN_162021 [Trichonephila inaurata madagascariensis]|uniref:Uncharacterized protein n=1 Tax=Trichonephila inaurata madagascariensis TaxID=2747483 RepID=A0A8X6YI66_9ARAC|nr:hypothetical protein TNIN_162021 [Trichonephila inaurata madagascariensis]